MNCKTWLQNESTKSTLYAKHSTLRWGHKFTFCVDVEINLLKSNHNPSLASSNKPPQSHFPKMCLWDDLADCADFGGLEETQTIRYYIWNMWNGCGISP